MAEREAFAKTRQIGGRDERRFAKIALPLPVFILEEVAFALFASQHLTCAGHFDPLRYSFMRFAFSRRSCHGAEKLAKSFHLATAFFRTILEPSRGILCWPFDSGVLQMNRSLSLLY